MSIAVLALLVGTLASTVAAQSPLQRAQQLGTEAIELYRRGRYREAIPKAREALALREQAQGPNHADVGTELNNLGVLLREVGEYAEARAVHERALQITEKALGPNHPEVATRLNTLALVFQVTGDYEAAHPLYERALRISEAALGPNHLTVSTRLNNLGGLLLATGKYAEARALYERALRIRQAALPPNHPDVGQSLSSLAEALRLMGAYAEARPLFEQGLRIREAALGPNHPNVGQVLNNYALLLQAMGDDTGARSLFERALRISEATFGPHHPIVGDRLFSLAALLQATGDYRGARPLYERALKIRETAVGPDHPTVSSYLNDLALLLQAMGDYAAARPLFERALVIAETRLGPNHPQVGLRLNNLALLLEATGDHAAARPLFERALTISEAALGPNHPTVGLRLNNLASLLQAIGDYPGARLLYERARQLQLDVVGANVELEDEALRALQRPSLVALRRYIALLAAVAHEPSRDPAATTPAVAAFIVAEQARSQSAQRALARAGARAAATDAATASLARQVQDLRDRLGAVRKRLVAEYGQPTERRNEGRITSLQQAMENLVRDLGAATTRLVTAFPGYAELASPEPIDPAAVAKLLRPDEALVSFFTLDDRVLTWALRANRSLVYRDIEVKRADLQALVAKVRSGLDQSLNPDITAGRLTPFDVGASYALYRLILEPVAAELNDVKHLIVVPDETLLPIPFGVLVTKGGDDVYRRLSELVQRRMSLDAGAFADYAKLSWLAREYAITVLPSATSLRALRAIARARGTDVEPFIGFGDPVLGGQGRQRGAAMVVARGGGIADALRRLPPLPGTRDELHAVARALGAAPDRALYLGTRATKPEVLSLDGAGRLGKASVISFATHALLAGELRGSRQPGLVLTPPAQATEQDDGLLSLDDIVQLKLANTDWLVLSACNTGADDGSGEALSGLARAFFFAGARALLVSHWSVDDRATQALMTQVFERYAQDPARPRAEALRQGMLALMTQAKGPTAYFAHPFAWAAFSIVGEGFSR